MHEVSNEAAPALPFPSSSLTRRGGAIIAENPNVDWLAGDVNGFTRVEQTMELGWLLLNMGEGRVDLLKQTSVQDMLNKIWEFPSDIQ